jgi:hypothetical protein
MYRSSEGGVVAHDEYVLTFDEPSAVQMVAETGEPLNEPDARDSDV